jgi:16S rRNA (cytosine1402-N4)-methyltransferase
MTHHTTIFRVFIGSALNYFRTFLLCVNIPPMEKLHVPILLNEIIDFIKLNSSGVYADLTFGEGGHSDAFLKKGVGRLIGVDRDVATLERYRKEGEYRLDPRLTLIHASFEEFLSNYPEKLDGILMDLGVSTRQILRQERGFSFQGNGPLDMRMDPTSERDLKEVLSEISQEELADFLYANTDIKGPRRIARILLDRFQKGELRGTADLAAIMGGARHGKTHPATALFLALRLLVNDELGQVERSLPLAIDSLKNGGRLAVISFHSVEDRIVKRQFLKLAGRCICEERICRCPRKEIVKILTTKPVLPSEKEMEENPRSRSAKLRIVEKI